MVLIFGSLVVQAVSLPDVIVTSISYNSATGKFISILKNQGAAATPSGVYIGVSYLVDNKYRTWGSVMGPLAAGASVTIGTNGSPYFIPSGDHIITVFADDLLRFAESNENNNKLSQPISSPNQTNSYEIQGFAAVARVTGGAGGKSIVVTNLNDTTVPGSLRTAVQTPGPRIITFTPGLTGTITLNSLLWVDNPNMTIDGKGANITISGYSLNLFKGSGARSYNFIIKNLTFTNTVATRSAINIDYGSYNVWIDHCSFHNNSSGSTGEPIAVWDRGLNQGGLTGITISWNHFKTPNIKSILVGSQDSTAGNTQVKTARVSIHHNWFEGSISARCPRVHGLGMLTHAWNNYNAGWIESAATITHSADFLSENNIYESTSTSGASAVVNGTPTANSISVTGSLLSGIFVANIDNVGTFPLNKISYSANLETANATLKSQIMQKAGAGK